MVTTRRQTLNVGGNATGGTGARVDKGTKNTSRAYALAKKAKAGKKAAGGKKRNGNKKAAGSINAGEETANGRAKPTWEQPHGRSPLPTPINSVGDLIPHRNNDNAVLELARKGMENKAAGAIPFGATNPGWMCYCNSIVTMLLNTTPFIGYVNRVHGSNQLAGLRDRDTSDFLEDPETDLLSRLNELAIIYWSDSPTNSANKQKQIDGLVRNFWNYTMDLNAPFTAAPWNVGEGSARDTLQDAAEYFTAILNIAIAQLRANPHISALDFQAMCQPLMQRRAACAGTGRSCPNERRRMPADDADAAGIFLVNVADGASLEACFVSQLRIENELICDRCDALPNPRGPGRLWWKFRETPEVLFIRITRFSTGRRPKKLNKSITIPESLDITAHLEQEDLKAGISAQYQLDSVVSHAGTLNTGHYITHARLSGKDRGWCCINDTTVTVSSFENAVTQKMKHGSHPFTPVILAYTKVHDTAQDAKSANDKIKKKFTNAGCNVSVVKDGGAKDRDLEAKNSEGKSAKRAGFKVSTRRTEPVSQRRGTQLAIFTASLFPIGDGDVPFEIVSQQVDIDFDVGVRDYVPIEVRLALPDGKQLSLKKLSGRRRQYHLAGRFSKETGQQNEAKTGSKAPKKLKKPDTKDLEPSPPKRKPTGSQDGVGNRAKKVKAA